MRRFRLQQVGQDLVGRAFALQSCGDRLVERAGHAPEAEPAHRLDHLMPLHRGLVPYRSGRSPRLADG